MLLTPLMAGEGAVWKRSGEIERTIYLRRQSFVLEDGHCPVKGFGMAVDVMRVNISEDCLIGLSEVFAEP